MAIYRDILEFLVFITYWDLTSQNHSFALILIRGVFSSLPPVFLGSAHSLSQGSILARNLFSHGEQFNFLPFLQFPIWGSPSQGTQNQTRSALPTCILTAPRTEPHATHLCCDGDMQVSFCAITFPDCVISRQHSSDLTLNGPPYICITGHFIFICQTSVFCPAIALMLTAFLFSATEAAVG